MSSTYRARHAVVMVSVFLFAMFVPIPGTETIGANVACAQENPNGGNQDECPEGQLDCGPGGGGPTHPGYDPCYWMAMACAMCYIYSDGMSPEEVEKVCNMCAIAAEECFGGDF